MGKLFKLKRWLTVPEAAAHLAETFSEKVTEADIYRLCLDCKLRLSAIFVGGALVKRFKLVEDESAIDYIEVPTLLETGKTIRIPAGGQIIYTPSGHMHQCEEGILSLDDDSPYDLTMLGGERCYVDELYWGLLGNQREERSCLDGTFVSDGRDVFQLQGQLYFPPRDGKAEYYPLGALPDDIALVVRTSELKKLEDILKSPVEILATHVSKSEIMEKPLSTKERNSLLTIIAALCDYSAVAHQERGISQKIVAMAKDMIPSISLDDGTVLKYLKQIPDALKAP